jgi:hypothetical protein
LFILIAIGLLNGIICLTLSLKYFPVIGFIGLFLLWFGFSMFVSFSAFYALNKYTRQLQFTD